VKPHKCEALLLITIKPIKNIAFFLGLLFLSTNAMAQTTRNMVEIVAESKAYSALETAVEVAGTE